MSQRNGGSQHEPGGDNNVYFHPRNAEEVVTYLYPHFLPRLQFTPMESICSVLDACAGDGALGKVFETHYNCLVDYQDIKDSGKSILEYAPEGEFNIIVCNPPWIPVKLAEAIYRHLLTLLAPGGVLLFVINNTFAYQGSERALALPFEKFYFLPRYVFAASGRPLLDCGVMIHHNGGIILAEAALLRPFIPLSRIKGEVMGELL